MNVQGKEPSHEEVLKQAERSIARIRDRQLKLAMAGDFQQSARAARQVHRLHDGQWDLEHVEADA